MASGKWRSTSEPSASLSVQMVVMVRLGRRLGGECCVLEVLGPDPEEDIRALTREQPRAIADHVVGDREPVLAEARGHAAVAAASGR